MPDTQSADAKRSVKVGDTIHRATDILGAAIGLPFYGPIMAILGLTTLLSVGRPIIFVQTRSGLDGKNFSLIKFRSMTEEIDTAGCLLADDQRVTKFGKLLRRSRLDELPELWNILKGEMSFIGPRPLLPETVKKMGVDGIIRGRVRPGLTGWAQISGNSSLTNEDKLTLDLWYIRNRSLSLDLFIIVLTIGVILFGEKINQNRLQQAWDERKLGRYK